MRSGLLIPFFRNLLILKRNAGPRPHGELPYCPEISKSFLMRIDPALWAELEAWAQDELRSVNGQIEYMLRQAVQKRKGGTGTAPPRRN